MHVCTCTYMLIEKRTHEENSAIHSHEYVPITSMQMYASKYTHGHVESYFSTEKICSRTILHASSLIHTILRTHTTCYWISFSNPIILQIAGEIITRTLPGSPLQL